MISGDLAMSDNQLKAFLEAVKADAALREKLKAVNSSADAVAIAKEAGFVISLDELSQAASRQKLSDAELENAAGARGITLEITCNCPDTINGYNCFDTLYGQECYP